MTSLCGGADRVPETVLRFRGHLGLYSVWEFCLERPLSSPRQFRALTVPSLTYYDPCCPRANGTVQHPWQHGRAFPRPSANATMHIYPGPDSE